MRGQQEFAFLFDPRVSQAGERIEEKRRRSFIRSRRFGESDLKLGLGHGRPSLMTAESWHFKRIAYRRNKSFPLLQGDLP
jgi:hypothetical protein